MTDINNDPYQLLNKDPTTKSKAKMLKQLKVLKYNNSGVSICPVVSYSGSPLYSLLNKYIPNFARDVKDENNNVKNPTMFANYIRNAPIEIEVMMV